MKEPLNEFDDLPKCSVVGIAILSIILFLACIGAAVIVGWLAEKITENCGKTAQNTCMVENAV